MTTGIKLMSSPVLHENIYREFQSSFYVRYCHTTEFSIMFNCKITLKKLCCHIESKCFIINNKNYILIIFSLIFLTIFSSSTISTHLVTLYLTTQL